MSREMKKRRLLARLNGPNLSAGEPAESLVKLDRVDGRKLPSEPTILGFLGAGNASDFKRIFGGAKKIAEKLGAGNAKDFESTVRAAKENAKRIAPFIAPPKREETKEQPPVETKPPVMAAPSKPVVEPPKPPIERPTVSGKPERICGLSDAGTERGGGKMVVWNLSVAQKWILIIGGVLLLFTLLYPPVMRNESFNGFAFIGDVKASKAYYVPGQLISNGIAYGYLAFEWAAVIICTAVAFVIGNKGVKAPSPPDGKGQIEGR